LEVHPRRELLVDEMMKRCSEQQAFNLAYRLPDPHAKFFELLVAGWEAGLRHPQVDYLPEMMVDLDSVSQYLDSLGAGTQVRRAIGKQLVHKVKDRVSGWASLRGMLGSADNGPL
jgi:hypothetical protein